MTNFRVATIFTLLTSLLISCNSVTSEKIVYEPTWESLAQFNEQPQWLKDAKLGIYFHWGPGSVPEHLNDWYACWMYQPNSATRKFHVETYGEDFQYHDLIPMFTGEHFDAKEWVDLFKKAGAKFAGPVTEHHDGFAMWDSEITPWNSADMGPKKDILREMFDELEKQGMKTIATFHHSKNLQRYKDSWEEEIKKSWSFPNSQFPYYPQFHKVFNDPKYAMLYGTLPEEEWNEKVWLGKLKEVIDNYEPDIIWFDTWLDKVPESYRQRFAAYYLNAAQKWEKDVVIVRKQEDLPLSMSILDHEKSRTAKANKDLWMTDDTFSTTSWFYSKGLKSKPTQKIVQSLVDAVSKNGVLLLNIAPRYDGTISEDQRKGLLELGGWLKNNGEAIYCTRPWILAAEGPTVEPEGGYSARKEFLNLEYSSKDIRYTASKDGKYVYAIVMSIPKRGETIELNGFTELKGKKVRKVQTLCGDKPVWNQDDKGKLTVAIENPTGEYAYVIKIKL